MRTRCADRVIVWMSISMIFAGLAGTGSAAERYLSPAAMVADGQSQVLYIAEATAGQVAVFDTKTQKIAARIPVPAQPTGLALTQDGASLYVTCGGSQGMVRVIDARTGKSLRTLPVGHTPMAPVLSPDDKLLYVCNRFNNNVSVMHTESGEQIARIPVLREPVAADITPDGNWLYVGNFLPYGPAIANSVACKISVINARTMALDRNIALPNGSTAVRSLIVSPDGRFVFVSHVLARYTVPTTQLERGWINTNALSIIDARTRTLLETVLLDDVDCGAANPWALSCTADAKYVCVTHAGTHELSIINLAALLNKIAGAGAPSSIPDDLSFLYGLRNRVKLTGKGPRAMAIIGEKAYVAEYFTDSLTVVDLSDKSRFKTTSIPLGPKMQMTAARRGEMLFNDASICFQSWQCCASCHPSDARPDGLNWDLLNDGIGNPKNTKSLLLSHKTPPAMITGIRSSAEVAVRAGIRHILFAVRPEEDAVAIDEYLKSLKPVPSPYLQNGKLSESARRGRALFEEAGCTNCHKPPLFTDLHKHDVGTGEGMEKDRRFDTPTLVEVWRTAPYLYDGRAATIEEVLTKYNPQDRHGATSDLTNDQVKDLAAFVLSQ